MSFEEDIAGLNELFFFREFTYSQNLFHPTPQKELELADNIVWFDNQLLIYQIKERQTPANTTPEKEATWFERKVRREGTKQIRNTLTYLKDYSPIQLTNHRGDSFELSMKMLADINKLVIYFPSDKLPTDCRRLKYHLSSTAGIIHLISAVDYLGICKTLITPAEVHNYLAFRQELIGRWGNKVLEVPEPALVGQYLADDLNTAPHANCIEHLRALERDTAEWDMSYVIHAFAERITTEHNATDYYSIVAELAKLKRNELRVFKKRFTLAMEKAITSQFTQPYRAVFPRTDCGFVFIPLVEQFRKHKLQELKGLTYAHKYDQRVSKCVGLSFIIEKGGWLAIDWCFMQFPWKYDSKAEKFLEENNPFREIKASSLPTYQFRKGRTN